ncbi:MAG: hypothetical protein P8P49_07115 [Opitutales bacterium]|nr:hypothetical protein [Opitutales bacterium]
MNIFQPNANRLKLLLVINFSLFSALAVCQLLVTSMLNSWLFLLCIIGACINLIVCYFINRSECTVHTTEEPPVSDDEKNKLMDDLEEEAKRRKQQDRIQQN